MYFKLEVSTEMLVIEAKNRGYMVEVINSENNFIRIWWNDNKYLEIIEATITKYSNLICFWKTEQKDLTKNILIENSFPTPKFILITDMGQLDRLNTLSYPLVVKPANTNFGDGVYLNLKDHTLVNSAIANCFKLSTKILVEEQMEGEDFRFLLINRKTVAIAKRVPPFVIGDGLSKIKSLIENVNLYRKQKLSRIYKQIHITDSMIQLLASHNLTLDSVPAKGELIYIGTIPNLSKGGASYNYSDRMPSLYIREIESVAQLFDNDVLGIDVIINLNEEPSTKNYFIIEVNDCPMISLHKFPVDGEGVNVERNLLDYYKELEKI